MNVQPYDLIVVGGGSGGIAAAVRAASHGARVALVENASLGGTCVNLGCVPKKVMFNAAKIAEIIKKAPDYGFKIDSKKPDWQRLVNAREQYIERLRAIYQKRLADNNIDFYQGHGSFVDNHTVAVNEQQFTAKQILIATGSKPFLPDIKGKKFLKSSDDFFHLDRQPQKVAIIGAGYIAIELAGVFNALGTETHILMRSQRPLSHFDETIGKELMAVMHQQGVIFHPEVDAETLEIQAQSDGKKSILVNNSPRLTDIDEVFSAIGRKANSENMHLSQIGVKLDEKKHIIVDDFQETTVKDIYAVGDCTQAPALTPVAIAAGRKLADRLFNKQIDAKLNVDHIPTVVFSHPPVASVGLSEEKAKSMYGAEAVQCYQTRFTPMFDALSEEKTPTLMKLVTVGIDEKIIGLHMLGYEVDEILQGFAVAISMGATKKDFDNTLAIHPTSAEELVTMT